MVAMPAIEAAETRQLAMQWTWTGASLLSDGGAEGGEVAVIGCVEGDRDMSVGDAGGGAFVRFAGKRLGMTVEREIETMWRTPSAARRAGSPGRRRPDVVTRSERRCQARM